MAVMKMISIGLLSSSMTLVQSQDTQTHLLARIRNKRDADPILDNLVGDFAKPFLNLFGGGQSSGGRKPRKKPQPHNHYAPAPQTYHKPLAQHSGYQPTYHTPSYAPAPAPVYHYTPAPAPVYHHEPEPVYHHKPEPLYHPAPVHKPEVHILPAPDLSQYSVSSSYVQEPEQPALPVTYHHEDPAIPPAYEPEIIPVYQPAPPPAYEPSPPVYEPSPPVYEPSPPVYEPSPPAYTPSVSANPSGFKTKHLKISN